VKSVSGVEKEFEALAAVADAEEPIAPYLLYADMI